MATPYSEVIEAFLAKVTDLDLPKFDDTARTSIVLGYMKAACTKFAGVCAMDLYDRDDILQIFHEDLDDEILDILAENMLVEWLKPKVLFSENLENCLNTKDFTQYSPANLLNQLRETLIFAKKEAKALINNYSFSHASPQELTHVRH